MLFADTSRRGRPFAKDPAVVRFGGPLSPLLLFATLRRRPGRGWLGHRHRPQQRPGFLGEDRGDSARAGAGAQRPLRAGRDRARWPGASLLPDLRQRPEGCHLPRGLRGRPPFPPQPDQSDLRADRRVELRPGDRCGRDRGRRPAAALLGHARSGVQGADARRVGRAAGIRTSAATSGRSSATRRSWRRSCRGSASASRRLRSAGTTAGCSCSTAAATTTSRSRSAAR